MLTAIEKENAFFPKNPLKYFSLMYSFKVTPFHPYAALCVGMIIAQMI